MPSSKIIKPGRYDYDLTVEFPSTYIPEHTPPAFRIADACETTRRRYVNGQFDLSAPVDHELLRQHFVTQACEDVDPAIVTVTRFELTPVTA
ncbi:hypothetical protein [Streptomyces rochei]|uniref:hypothetical protein n=1 Tax=Streptomyces rochei TaxID=1928 RepID=UPI00249EFB62|nr:hypothetical protein [Streptomyces rochei]